MKKKERKEMQKAEQTQAGMVRIRSVGTTLPDSVLPSTEVGLTPKEELDLPPRHSLDPDCISLFLRSLLSAHTFHRRAWARWAPGPPKHPPGHSEKLHRPWSCEGQVPPEGRRLQEPGAFPPRPVLVLQLHLAARVLCARIPEPAPAARRARLC